MKKLSFLLFLLILPVDTALEFVHGIFTYKAPGDIQLGTGYLAILGQLLGTGMNLYQGYNQMSEGETLAETGREQMLATAGATDELLSSVDEQKRLSQKAGDVGQERLDQSVTGLLDALASGDPSAYSAIPSFGSNLATTSQDIGSKTAQNIALANAPAVQAAEAEMDVYRGLSQYDLQQGTAAYQAGQQTVNQAYGDLFNMPMDMAALEVQDPEAYSNLFRGGGTTKKADKGAFVNSDVINELINASSGALVYTGGGVESASFQDLIGKEEKMRLGVDNPLEDTNLKDAWEALQAKIEEEEYLNRYNRGRGADGTIEDLPVADRKDGGKVQDYIGGGSTLSQLLRPGQSFQTGGIEDHDVQEYDISDAETGQVVAKTTGQEDHMVNEDGSITVINSEQNESIHDAFKDVDIEMVLESLKNNPQKGNVRELLSALNKVFRQKQFQS